MNIDLPLTTEAVEVINKGAAHERLKSLVHIAQIDALGQNFVALYVDINLGNSRQHGGKDRRQLRAFAGGLHERSCIVSQELDIMPTAVFQDKRGAARSSHAGNCRRRKSNRNACRKLAQLFVDVNPDGVVGFLRGFALPPFLERHPKEGTKGILNAAYHVVADNAGHMIDPPCFHQNVLHGLTREACALQR